MATSSAEPPLFPVAQVPSRVLQAVVAPKPFKADSFHRMGKQHQFFDVIVVKGSFALENGELVPCAKQAELQWHDEYWDEDNAELSSLKTPADIELIKPGADVLITGTVKSLNGKPSKEWSGMLRVVRDRNEVLIDKTLCFTGPRLWTHGLLMGWTLGAPEPATAIPLRYELAYGGWWDNPKEKDPALARQIYLPNPSGSGHFGKSHDTRQRYPGPQIIPDSRTIQFSNRDYTPGGFGPIARFWPPRAQYAGTYDDAWFRQFNAAAAADCIPDYPADFDYRAFQCAPPDQMTPTPLRGDESIHLSGLFDDQRNLLFDLPRLSIRADLYTQEGELHQEAMRLDTLHIDLDTRHIHLTWRLTLPQTLGIVHAELHSHPIKARS